MPSELEDTVGDILQKARQGKGWSESQLAQKSGVAVGKIRQLEQKDRLTRFEELTGLAGALGLEEERLRVIAAKEWGPNPFPEGASEEVLCLKGYYYGNYEVKGYLLLDPATREAVLFDTAYNPDLVLKTLAEKKLTLRAIFLTHAHGDHMSGVSRIRNQTKAPVYIHPGEGPLYRRNESIPPDHWAEEGMTFRLGDRTVQFLETPGHTPGGLSYRSGPYCFVGDALFAGSTGRSYSPEGYRSLLDALKKKVLTLPEETLLCPGHGPSTSVWEERRHNPFFP